jgi:competence protein ComEC
VWWSPVIARWLGDATGEAGGWRGAVAATVSAQLATAPLLARFGGTLTVASLPANLVAVPAAGATMVWSWTFGLVAAIWPPLGAVNSFVVGLATGFVLNIGQGAAAHPIATIPWFLAWSVAAAVAIVMWRRPNVVSPISPPSGPAQAPS